MRRSRRFGSGRCVVRNRNEATSRFPVKRDREPDTAQIRCDAAQVIAQTVRPFGPGALPGGLCVGEIFEAGQQLRGGAFPDRTPLMNCISSGAMTDASSTRSWAASRFAR